MVMSIVLSGMTIFNKLAFYCYHARSALLNDFRINE